MKVLVIQKKRIGDVLTSTVIFEAIKQKYPDSELHYLIYENALAVVENNPFIDKIVVLNESIRKSKRKFLSFLFSIRKEKYDVVIDAYGKPNSVLIGWFSGAKIKVTFDKIYSRIFYSHSIIRNTASFSKATKAIEHRMLLLKPLGIDFSEISPKIFLTDLEKEVARKILTNYGVDFSKKLVMISALGSNEMKTYPFKMMAEVLDEVCLNREIQLLFNYLPFQKQDALKIYRLCNYDTQKKILIDFYEDDLRKFLAITSLCDALIGNEGGATNMSKALSIATFTIFSPVVPKLDWNMFENEDTIISVHISDYKNKDNESQMELYYHQQKIPALYQYLNLSNFKDKLTHFLNFNC